MKITNNKEHNQLIQNWRKFEIKLEILILSQLEQIKIIKNQTLQNKKLANYNRAMSLRLGFIIKSYQQQMLGYTTIKFSIACLLIAFILYNTYSLYEVWSASQTLIIKIFYFLLIVSACAIMYTFNGVQAIRQFLIGAGRYNLIRTLDNRIKLIPKQPQIYQPPKPTKSKEKYASQQHKFKRSHSVTPAEFRLKQLNPKQPEARKVLRSLSSPMSSSSDETDIFAFQIKQRNTELINLLTQYEAELKKNIKKTSSEKQKIDRAKRVLGIIFRNEANRQQNQKKELIQKLQIMFQIHIVEAKKSTGSQNFHDMKANRWKAHDWNQKILTDRYREVLLDEIMQGYANDSLGRSGLKLRNLASQDLDFRSRTSTQIMKLINERIKLDKQMNFNCECPNDRVRQKTIEKLKEISAHYLENKHLSAKNAIEEFENARLMVWILAQYINDIVRPLADEFLVYLEPDSKDIDRKYYIRWLPSKTAAMPHFYQTVEVYEGKQCKKAENICAPGIDNLASLFVSYLTYLKQQFKTQLLLVPILQDYIDSVLGTLA